MTPKRLSALLQTGTFRQAVNILLPLGAAGAIYANIVCDTGCTYLYGALFGIDLHYLGIMLVLALLLFALPIRNKRYQAFSHHLRANLLWMAVGGGAVLLHFQWTNQLFCPFCLVYGAIIFILFLFNFNQTPRTAAAVSFATGLIVFALFFEGSVMPVFQF